MKKVDELSIDIIKKRFHQIQKISLSNNVPFTALSKELGVRKTALMDFIELNPYLFEVKAIKGQKELHICDVFSRICDNIKTEEWLNLKREEYDKALELDFLSDWGCIYGCYLEVSHSDHRKDEYLNTKEKLEFVINKYNLIVKEDVSHGRDYPKGSVKITYKEYDNLVRDGWKLIVRNGDSKNIELNGGLDKVLGRPTESRSK